MVLFKPQYVRQAEFMKKIHTLESFTSMRSSLDDVETFDIILDRSPQYLMFKPLSALSYDTHWTQFFGYNYLMIRDERESLNRDLQEYLYQPSRIQKWIEAGNEIEDYMK